MNVLFVCLGNICRSPLAEALFEHKIREAGLTGKFGTASCGTANYHIGDAPDSRTILNAAKNGITIRHVGRMLSEKDLEGFDLILAMDISNYNNIMRLKNAARHKDKIRMMRDFDSLDIGGDVPDPWSGGEKDFQEVFSILDRSVDGLIRHLTSDLKPRSGF